VLYRRIVEHDSPHCRGEPRGSWPVSRPRRASILQRRLLPLVLCFCAMAHAYADEAVDGRPNALSLFAGRMTSNQWEDVVLANDVDFRQTFLAGIGLSQRLGSPIDGLTFELEGQVVRHFGREHLWEFNVPVIVRWSRFPWNETLRTSVAWGLGLSYTTEAPPEERAVKGDSERVLFYWVAELEAGVPHEPWSAILRLHHRSPGFGALGERGGSNWVVLGLRWRF
jgi:hypothetical protein